MYDENRIYYCNENAMGLLGFKDFNGQGENLSLIDFVSDKASLYRHIRQIINGDDDVYYYICELYSSNVEGKLVEIVSKKYSYQGQPIVLSVIQDMNSSRRLNKSEPSYSLGIYCNNRGCRWTYIHFCGKLF